MSEWLPIKTAPKEGEVVFGAHGEVVSQMAWYSEISRWVYVYPGDFMDCEPYQPAPSIGWAPTHWMPLPRPPAEETPAQKPHGVRT